VAGWITSLASGLSSLVTVVARLSVVREVPGSIPGAGSWLCYIVTKRVTSYVNPTRLGSECLFWSLLLHVFWAHH